MTKTTKTTKAAATKPTPSPTPRLSYQLVGALADDASAAQQAIVAALKAAPKQTASVADLAKASKLKPAVARHRADRGCCRATHLRPVCRWAWPEAFGEAAQQRGCAVPAPVRAHQRQNRTACRSPLRRFARS